jgi:hypothetical protein
MMPNGTPITRAVGIAENEIVDESGTPAAKSGLTVRKVIMPDA